MPVLELYDEPGWLQVVHGANVSNRVRGRLVAPSRNIRLLPGLLGDVGTPQPIEMVIDILVAQPQRIVRESGRALVKALLCGFWGRKA